ncbi:transposase [Bacteroidota bacterium]|jgi:transposase
MKRSRRKFTAEFKAKVALEAIKEQKSLSELAEQFELHPNLISIWKREFLENASNVFSKNNDDKRFIAEAEKEKEELFKQIGQLKVENDWLKKKVL